MDIRQIFFKLRSITPIPIIIIAIIWSKINIIATIIGLIFIIIGEIIRISGVAYAGMRTRTRNVGANELVTSGPYSIARNPLYIGNFFLSVGFCIFANSLTPWLLIFFIILFFIQYGLIISLEEEKLTELFGDKYLIYKLNVPKIIPNFKKFQSENGTKPYYNKAFRSEIRTFQAIFILIIIIIGRNLIKI